MPRETPERPGHTEVSTATSSAATTPTKTTIRHLAKDYSYVFGELRRIAIIVLVVVAGLVAAAIALR
jgi:hypothetical protein